MSVPPTPPRGSGERGSKEHVRGGGILELAASLMLLGIRLGMLFCRAYCPIGGGRNDSL